MSLQKQFHDFRLPEGQVQGTEPIGDVAGSSFHVWVGVVVEEQLDYFAVGAPNGK